MELTDAHWEHLEDHATLAAWEAFRINYPREQWDAELCDVLVEAAVEAIRSRIEYWEWEGK